MPAGRVVLIRHASPCIDTGRCGWREARVRMAAYNQTPHLKLEEAQVFRQGDAWQQVRHISSVFASPLPRALKTAQALFPHTPLVQVDALREFDLAIAPIPALRLAPRGWFALSRLLWLLHLNPARATWQQERQRVEAFLPALRSGEHVVVAHGFVLRKIRRAFRQWRFQRGYRYRQGCFSVEIWACASTGPRALA